MSAWKTINEGKQAEARGKHFFRQNTTWQTEQLAELKYKLERAKSNTTAERVKGIKRRRAHYCLTRWRRSAGRCSTRKWNTRFMNVLSVAARRAIKSERGGRQRVMRWRKRRTVRREQRWCTHSKRDGLDWHACGPSALSGPYVFLNLSNAQLSFLLPPASAAVQGPPAPM